MTYYEYWHGNPEMLRFYRESYKIKRKNENFNLWLQGRYFYEAIICASPATNPLSKARKCYPYPENPFPLTKAEQEEQEEQRRIKRYHEMRSRMMAEYQQQQIKKDGEQNA